MPQEHSDIQAIFASLRMQVELGVDEWIVDTPVNWVEVTEAAAKAKTAKAKAPPMGGPVKGKAAHDHAGQGGSAPDTVSGRVPDVVPDVVLGVDFSQASTLDELRALLKAHAPAALTDFAENMVPDYGPEDARVLVVVDPPGADVDIAGDISADPGFIFAGQAFASVGLAADFSVLQSPYATLRFVPYSPWRLPMERAVTREEDMLFSAYIAAYIEIFRPDIVVTMGTRLGRLAGIENYAGKPVVALMPPLAVMRAPHLKRRMWEGLCKVRAALEAKGSDK